MEDDSNHMFLFETSKFNIVYLIYCKKYQNTINFLLINIFYCPFSFSYTQKVLLELTIYL